MLLRSGRVKGHPIQSWDELPYELLLEILRRLPLADRLSVICMVSKTWLSAVLDLLSYPGVIDLTVLDSPQIHRSNLSNRLCYFIKRRLDNLSPDSCSTFLLASTFVQARKYEYIAERTPSMQELMVISPSAGFTYVFMSSVMKYWKKLKKVRCASTAMQFCHNCFTEVETLWLFGPVNDDIASTIRDEFPRLKQLRLHGCALTTNALSIILDGHRDLELLDTRHCFRVPGGDEVSCEWVYLRTLEWNEEEIRVKAAGVKVHLQCARELCIQCAVPLHSCIVNPNESWKSFSRLPSLL